MASPCLGFAGPTGRVWDPDLSRETKMLGAMVLIQTFKKWRLPPVFNKIPKQVYFATANMIHFFVLFCFVF